MPLCFLPFLHFGLTVGITGIVGCMINLGGGMFLLWPVFRTGAVGVFVAGFGASRFALTCVGCTCSAISSNRVLRRVLRRWIWGDPRTASRDVGACESVGVVATLCVCAAWVATLCGAWYSDNVLVSERLCFLAR